ncbi:MAG: 16S rRNA (guanine(966)-N(2))-methyltransferase RsmD [Flavobacteriales bacterium]|nr:16S rRNA (guanine(966)-N(2))-methyltransferase RsmD [Flavobacteriales bacterium]
MRIISGLHKGRSIRPPKNLPVRPTTDMAKEGLFNILNNLVEFDALNVLDLFCGTGNISFEFISRGALSVTSVDANSRCAGFVKSTFDELKYASGSVIKADALRFVESSKNKWNMIFADPPYEYDQYHKLVNTILDNGLLAENGILIMEHPAEVDFSTFPTNTQTRKYGRVHFSFFELEA